MELLSLINQLDGLVESGARVPWTGKSLISAHAVVEILDRMRAAIPPELREAQEVRVRTEAIITEAIETAKGIRARADQDYKAAVNQSRVLKEAQAQATEIRAQAEREAQQIRQLAETEAFQRRREADSYAKESLARLLTPVQALGENLAVLEADIAQLEGSIRDGIKYIDSIWEQSTPGTVRNAESAVGHLGTV